MSSEHLNNEINRLRLELTTLKEDAGASNISIANYLLTRLSQLGVKVSAETALRQMSGCLTRDAAISSPCLVCQETSTLDSW